MNYTSSTANGGLDIKLNGEFTFADNEQFQAMVKGIISSSAKSVVLDFAALEFIDSAALSMLLVMKDSCDKARKNLSIKNSNGRVKEVLNEMKFAKFIRITP